ncbi:putative reverse transcriptase domain-containing protein [Tanacetum coccineum]
MTLGECGCPAKCHIPFEQGTKLDKGEKEARVDATQYLRLVDPRQNHSEAAKRVLRYLKGTPGQGILLPRDGPSNLTAYCDSDWLGCPFTRRLRMGYLLILGGGPISWRTKKQSVVSRSSAEAEYRAMASPVGEILWVRWLLKDLQVDITTPTPLFCDNQAARHIANNPAAEYQQTIIKDEEQEQNKRSGSYSLFLNEDEYTRSYSKGADDEEISEGGIPRVIVLGYDGLPIQPVAPPSPDYIPGPEDPQTPPVPQDEDEREPMFVQAHDPDYVPEPIYPEYIPLEDEHEFLAEEQPLPPVDSPTAESPGYVTESDPEEDPEEYEDDETEDGPVDYPIDGGDDGDDDDGDSSGDDADGEDEDEEDEDEEDKEDHLALADSTIVVPVHEPVFPPEGTEPVIPPPSTDITIGARITVRPHISISLPPEAEVERLLAMTTPSPPISLSPPSAGEHLALIDVVTATLPSPLVPPSLYIPPPVDHRDEIPESEQSPRKRLCLSTLGSRYEVGESSTARPTRGWGIDYGFVSTVDAEERRHGIRDVGYDIRYTWVDPAEAVPEIVPMTVGEVNTRVTELAELHDHDTHDLYALQEDAQDSRSRISQRVDMDSQWVDLLMGDRMTLQGTIWMVEEEAYAS